MIDKVTTYECCLCKACSNVCPTDAIVFSQKMWGAAYPEIETEKCIGCDRCEAVCPVLEFQSYRSQEQIDAYAVQSNNTKVRKHSSSGGVFFEIAKKIITEGGCVSGAIIDDKFNVKHILVENEADLKQLCGSKYVQSDTKGIYKEIKRQLLNGRKVLFCGCPCQIAGLRKFLGNIPQTLYLAELVCHGNAGNDFFESYLALHKKRSRSQVKRISFRDKTLGWHRSSMKILYANGKSYLEPITVDAYMKGFLSGIFMKESCFQCKFKDGHSGSDLSLGDFWGAEIEKPELDDNTGLSAVIVRTSKGEELLKTTELKKWDIEVEKIIKYNRNVVESTKRPFTRDEFFAYAEKNGYETAINDLLWEKKIAKLKRKVRFGLRCVKYKLLRKGDILY